MTQKNYTDITIILDKSASMNMLRQETIDSLNIFIKDQKKVDGVAKITLVQFNHRHEEIFKSIPLVEFPVLTEAHYKPTGGTALLDAIGQTVEAAGSRFREMKAAERPEKVFVVILTDGEENSSRNFSYSEIKKVIEHQQDKYSWEFVFLGANIDVEEAQSALGTKYSYTFTASREGHRAAMRGMSLGISNSRSTGDSYGISYNNALNEAVGSGVINSTDAAVPTKQTEELVSK